MKIDGNESLRQIAQYGRDLSFGIAPRREEPTAPPGRGDPTAVPAT